MDWRRWPVAALWLIWALSGVAWASADACGPFGNPPARIIKSVKPNCPNGVRLGPWSDADGTPRYACLYAPPRASPAKPLPLVVYLHPSLATADSASNATNLLGFLKTANVSDDPAHPGFILLAPQGRDTAHQYPWPDRTGTGWDIWYRQLNPSGAVKVGDRIYGENADAAAIDHFIAAVAADGKVDRNRIYLTGWSNGGSMAYLYGLNRPAIAAVGVYSSPSPFQMKPDACPQAPVAAHPADDREVRVYNPALAAYQVHNSCDIGGICPNVLFFERQLTALGGNDHDTIIDRNQRATPECDAFCGSDPGGGLRNPLAAMLGMAHHLRWPRPWTAAMLNFFRRHPLKPNSRAGSRGD